MLLLSPWRNDSALTLCALRLSGFLEDPRVPAAVRNDVARVYVTPDGA